MARIPTVELTRYLLARQMSHHGCLRVGRASLPSRAAIGQTRRFTSPIQSSTPASPAATPSPPVPLRKQLKDQARALKASGYKKKKKTDNQTVPGWELTVGIEIHAQLNTARKLFSPAATSFDDRPNSHVALFDLAVPGSQPIFQPETLIPAVRAALALECDIQRVSRFDRKHYFHWDQPAGYQITQFYEPFAKDGHIKLYARDGIAAEDGEEVTVGIKQVQMEQDTAKTVAMAGETHRIDFNRVGVPLIEIITLPEMHHPATAAAFVRKVQMLLSSVDACTSGLEEGGLRADVNVSVRRTDDASDTLGTRTEIKNLSSFKAVEDAIIAERDRQIAVLEAGGAVQGETRGWSVGSIETRRLRGKEGEVDYRYMPDPDLGPVVIGEQLIEHLAKSMGTLPDGEVDLLINTFGLTAKDALALKSLDDGIRVEYFYNVVRHLEGHYRRVDVPEELRHKHSSLAANWCLHELGKLVKASNELGWTENGECVIPSASLAEILYQLQEKKITAKVAKELLWMSFRQEIPGGHVVAVIDTMGLWFKELSENEYAELADEAAEDEDKVLSEFLRFKDGKSKAYPQGKLMFLVGKMMRAGPEEQMDPGSAERVMRKRIDKVYVPSLQSKGAS
ncbi:amidotransferase-like protein [Lasiosphaeris hirsuta]|uniref:Glutamyl-tRNA(Gln) amidotransferase subunit B, mitochondrial n=1 Tax=Lasiosphaeris hirsuta TaxID=260670 RepID=A0AA40E3A7_9PEZI|nr:amidotransferase-like protein [Lasiosphaeris hirsuta]